MNLPAISAGLFLVSFACLTLAKAPLPLPTDSVSLEIAAPPMEGTVSIGVFDDAEKCVRILYEYVPLEKIPSALNGFLVTWDGRLADGKSAPAGSYEIRGVTVGNINLRAEAYHFNDWIDPEAPTNAPVSIEAVRLLANGSFLTSQKRADNNFHLTKYSRDGAVEQTITMPSAPLDFLVDSELTFAVTLTGLFQVNLDEQNVLPLPMTPRLIGRRLGGMPNLTAVVENSLVRLSSENNQSEKIANLPPDISLLSVRESTVIVSDGSSVFQLVGTDFQKVDLPKNTKISHLAIGRASFFWAIIDGKNLIEFDLSSQAVRSLEAEDNESFLTFDVSPDDQQIAVVSSFPGRQRFRILQLSETPSSEVSVWKTVLQKDLESCDSFGFDQKTGELLSTGGITNQQLTTLSLIENLLSPNEKPSLKIQPQSRNSSLVLSTENGLPLIEVAPGLTSTRLALVQGENPGSIRFFAYLSGAVAEYSVTGLDKMMQFTSEKFTWPPGPRQLPDEVNVPAIGPAPTPE